MDIEPRVIVPKGTNFTAAQQWLSNCGIDIPQMTGRQYIDTVADQRRRRQWTVVYAKDADIPRKILSLGGLGVVGSDVLGELSEDQTTRLQRLSIGPIVQVNPEGPYDDALKFAVLSRLGEADYIRRKLRGGKPIRIGTSYPMQTQRMLGDQAIVTQVAAGGAESLPWEYDPCTVPDGIAVDAIVELVLSNRTMEANKLEMVQLPGRESTIPVMLEAITRQQL